MYVFVYNICTYKYKKNVYKSMQRETWAAYMVILMKLLLGQLGWLEGKMSYNYNLLLHIYQSAWIFNRPMLMDHK